MIPSQSLPSFPVFGDNATKVMPDNGGSKYSNGFQQSDVLPAEWVNWEWNKASTGVTELNTGMASVEGELNNVLSEAGATPDGTKTDQVYKAVRKNCGCIMASSLTISSAPSIDTNNVVKIMFTSNIAANDETTGMVITYKGTGYPVWACKDGTLVTLKGHTINGSTKYLQANTILELIFDGSKFIVIDNPVVLSGDGYKVHANGKVGDEAVGDVKAKATNDIPYGWLECNGQSVLRADYPELFEKFNTQTYDGSHTLLSRYGSVDATHFNLPDYREAALVGTGQNSGDSITTHDTYTLGQFRDDQLQDHKHTGYHYNASGSTISYYAVDVTGKKGYNSDYIQGVTGGRNGNVTRGKRKGVTYIIKVMA